MQYLIIQSIQKEIFCSPFRGQCFHCFKINNLKKLLLFCSYFQVHMLSLVEEERRVRANDREYNEKFQYAVRKTTPYTQALHRHLSASSSNFLIITFCLCTLPQYLIMVHLIMPPIMSPPPPMVCPEKLHHDLKIQHHYLPGSQPL